MPDIKPNIYIYILPTHSSYIIVILTTRSSGRKTVNVLLINAVLQKGMVHIIKLSASIMLL